MRAPLGFLATCALISLPWFALQGCNRADAPTPAETRSAAALPALHQPAPPPVPARPALRHERRTLGSGETLDGALGELGLAPPDRAGLIASIREWIDPRRLPRGTGLSVARRAGKDAVESVGCRTEQGRFVRAHREADGGWRGELVALPVEVEIDSVGGVIRASVAQALSGVTNGPRLTTAFADIFQWDIDLLVDPRPGDELRLVYEVMRLGPVPADLPPLGPDGPAGRGDLLGVGRVLAARYDGSQVSSAAYWVENPAGRSGYYDDDGQPLQKTFLKSPLNYTRISSGFSRARRHPITRRVVPHHGVDFVAPHGSPVVATADGRVKRAEWQGALGRAVTLRHGNGYETIYGHLSRYAKGIRPGVEVRQNQLIGYVGATGRATGTHLHYTLKHHGRALDPLRFKSPPADPLDSGDLAELARVRTRWQPALAGVRLSDPGMTLAEGSPADPPGPADWGG